MTLSYKDQSTQGIFDQLRSTQYYSGSMLYSQDNIQNFNLTVNLNPQQLALQADVFSRQTLTLRSDFEFKRFLGSNDEVWLSKLHLTYVYARIKALFLGLKSNYTFDWPIDSYNFPGNVLLSHYLKTCSFQYHSEVDQPLSIYINVKPKEKFLDMVEPIFEAYPELKEGLSDSDSHITYVNSYYESILRGLLNGKRYLENSRGGRGKSSIMNIYDLVPYDHPDTIKHLKKDLNPILNSFLNQNQNKFYFIKPDNQTGLKSLRFNESLFLPRAIGICNSDVNDFKNNSYYLNVERDYFGDPFTRDEVYAITGLKTEIIPYSIEQILSYLSDEVLDFSEGGTLNIVRGSIFRQTK